MHINLSNHLLRLVAPYKRPSFILSPSNFDVLIDSPFSTIKASYLNPKHSSWLSRSSKSVGNTFAQYLGTRNDIAIAMLDSPTHYSNNLNYHPDILDLFIFKTGNRCSFQNLSSELSSDFTPIFSDFFMTVAQTSSLT